MSAALHMLHLPLDMRRVLRFGEEQGLVGGRLPADDGYLVHAVLTALFGGRAPKPFALPSADAAAGRGRNGNRADYSVLAYSAAPLTNLRAEAEATADPAVFRALDWDLAADKPMPTLAAGTHLAYRVRVCPVTRLARGSTARTPGSEMDAYEAACLAAERAGTPMPARDAVYVDWLRSRLDSEALAIGPPAVTTRRSVDLLRRARPSGEPERPLRRLRRPDVTFTGEMEVRDPHRFAALLTRGIGRHRAFGFGMMLLRRPEQSHD